MKEKLTRRRVLSTSGIVTGALLLGGTRASAKSENVHQSEKNIGPEQTVPFGIRISNNATDPKGIELTVAKEDAEGAETVVSRTIKLRGLNETVRPLVAETVRTFEPDIPDGGRYTVEAKIEGGNAARTSWAISSDGIARQEGISIMIYHDDSIKVSQVEV